MESFRFHEVIFDNKVKNADITDDIGILLLMHGIGWIDFVFGFFY
ncbi:MAG: hypothetical protein ACI9CZ_001107 [Flavobacterium sp.]|jgi:hypothetical protein